MAITAISRNFNGNPNFVYVVTSDNLATITTASYITDQATNIQALQNGDFQWETNDYVLIQYSGGEAFFTYDSTNATFVAAATVPGSLSNTLSSGNIFVGSAGNVATGVNPTGDIDVTNTGVFSITAGAIVNADVNAAAAIAFSKLAALPSAEILLGSAGNVATATAVTGDVTISNTGVTAIAAGAIVNADVNAAAAIDFSKLAALASARLLVGSAGNVATAVDVTGDVTIGNTGVTAVGANKILSSMMSPLLLKYATVNLSAAQFNGAYAAPVQLVAAAGANTLLVLESLDLVMTYGTTQFANGGVAHVQYDSTANGAGVIASSTQAAANFFDAASTALHFNTGVVKQPLTTAVNKGLYFSNVTGAFDTGDSTFVAHIRYYQIPTA